MSGNVRPVALSGMPESWCEPHGNGFYRLLDVDSDAGVRIERTIADEEVNDDPDFLKFSWIREYLIHTMENCRICFIRFGGDTPDRKGDVVALDRVGDIDLSSVFGDFLERVRTVSGKNDTKSVVMELVNSLYGSVGRVVGLYLRLLECAGASLDVESVPEGSSLSFMSPALARLLIRDYGFRSHNKVIRLLAGRFYAGFPDDCGVRDLEVPEVDTVVDGTGILTVCSVPCGGRKLAKSADGPFESVNDFLDTVVVESARDGADSDCLDVSDMPVNGVEGDKVESGDASVSDECGALSRVVDIDGVPCDRDGQSRDVMREKLVSGVRRNIRESRKNGNFMKSLNRDSGGGTTMSSSVQTRVFMDSGESGGSVGASVNFNKSRMPVVADEGVSGVVSGASSLSDRGSGHSDEYAARIDSALESLKRKKSVKVGSDMNAHDVDGVPESGSGNVDASEKGVTSSRIDGHLYGRVYLRYLSVPYRVSRFVDVDLTEAFDRIVAVNSWDESLRQYCRRKVSVDASSDLWVVSRIMECGGLDVMRAHIGKEMACMSLMLIPELAADVEACGFRFDYLLSRFEMCVSVNDIRCFLSSRNGFNNSVGALFDYLVRDAGTHV